MISLYIHIPFCEVKCGYCDFFSIPRGWEDFDLQKEYTEALIREIDTRVGAIRESPLQSIFFGGGTPSLLAPVLLEKIFSALQRHFIWDNRIEITLETNPKTVSLEKLKDFRSLGINRLSVGVQSFQDKFLKVLGRIHSGDEAIKTLSDARKAGFENVSLDLIYALPGQSLKEWKEDLEEALKLETNHLSAYHLTIEKGTPFEKLYGRGDSRIAPTLPSEEEGVECLQWTRERCQTPMRSYEISNFSKPGFESIHNQNYWQYGEYLGFGTAAASFTKRYQVPFGKRSTNTRNLKKYLEGQWSDFSEEIDISKAMGEFCMLGLRTREGIRRKKFHEEFGESLEKIYSSEIKQFEQKGWLEFYPHGWRLTESGILFADEVAVAFLK